MRHIGYMIASIGLLGFGFAVFVSMAIISMALNMIFHRQERKCIDRAFADKKELYRSW